MIDRAIPRSGYEVYCKGSKVGQVTSGGYFPTLRKNMGLVLIDKSCVDVGNIIEVQVRSKPCKAQIIQLPFYSRKRGK